MVCLCRCTCVNGITFTYNCFHMFNMARVLCHLSLITVNHPPPHPHFPSAHMYAHDYYTLWNILLFSLWLDYTIQSIIATHIRSCQAV